MLAPELSLALVVENGLGFGVRKIVVDLDRALFSVRIETKTGPTPLGHQSTVDGVAMDITEFLDKLWRVWTLKS